MARTSLTLDVDLAGIDPLVRADINSKSGRELLNKIIKHLNGANTGAKNVPYIRANVNGAAPFAAWDTVACASVVATNALSINGQALTAVASGAVANQFNVGGSDTLTATALAACINASTTADIVIKHVTASNLAVTITLSSATAGTGVRIAGFEFIGRSVIPTNPPDYGSFDISGTDTADATSLTSKINAHPVLSKLVVATSSSGVVTVRQRSGTSSLGKVLVIAAPGVTPSGITVGAADFAATSTVLVSSRFQGHAGNAVTCAQTSGATMTVLTARLANGTGADGTAVDIIQGNVR